MARARAPHPLPRTHRGTPPTRLRGGCRAAVPLTCPGSAPRLREAPRHVRTRTSARHAGRRRVPTAAPPPRVGEPHWVRVRSRAPVGSGPVIRAKKARACEKADSVAPAYLRGRGHSGSSRGRSAASSARRLRTPRTGLRSGGRTGGELSGSSGRTAHAPAPLVSTAAR